MNDSYLSFESFCHDKDLIDIKNPNLDISVDGILLRIDKICRYSTMQDGKRVLPGKEFVVFEFKKIKTDQVKKKTLIHELLLQSDADSRKTVELIGLGRILAYNSSDLLSILAQKQLKCDLNGSFKTKIIQYPVYKKDPSKKLIALTFFIKNTRSCDIVRIEENLHSYYLEFRRALNKIVEIVLNQD